MKEGSDFSKGILNLRPYQLESLSAIQSHFDQGVRCQLVSLPCGAGKTVVFANLIKQMERRTLVLAHTNELLEQARQKILMICPELQVGIVNGQHKQFERDVVVASIQSARQEENLKLLKSQCFTLAVYDESHRAANDSSRFVLKELGFDKESNANKLLVGFTATAFRSDSKGLLEVFEKIVYQKNIREMIDEGYLCPPVGIRVATNLDLTKVVVENGDFSAISLAKVMDTPDLNHLVVQAYIEKAIGRKAICFGVTIAHALNIMEKFRARNISSACVHGNMPIEERNAIIKKFENGEISVLTNCQILTEGFDCSSVDCIIMARPTKSTGLYIQSVGRGLRLFPNKKDCLVIDFGEVSHNLCGVNILIGDKENDYVEERSEKKESEFIKSLPAKLNQKLKKALLEFDMLGNNFTWQKDSAGTYFLQGNNVRSLKILPSSSDDYSVVFFDGDAIKRIATDLSFEYAFACAEEFAKANRSLFVINDLLASWRNDPITEKQISLFKRKGYRKGLESMTKGQASLIIQSGVLKKAPTNDPSRQFQR